MIERILSEVAFSKDWGRQMRFISGPRQSGKTTLARQKLQQENCQKLYYLWDLRSVKNCYKDNELFFTADKPPDKEKIWICFDEIHKMPKWKNILKGLYDSTFENYNFIITGSAKFDIIKRSGDSLSGRYFTFHLFPLCLAELVKTKQSSLLKLPASSDEFIKRILSSSPNAQAQLDLLLQYSGFPEPFCNQSQKFYNKWSQNYSDSIIKEDIGALTRITNQEYIYELYKLLPEFVGSPTSESSLASHIETSQPTIKNYLKKLEDFYLAFRIYPYSKNIKRSLLKAPKCYLYNWAEIKDPGKRFENYLAVELKTLLTIWNDVWGKDFGLFYIRNKNKQETDFLITKNKDPWLLIEAKYSDTGIEKHHFQTQEALKNIPLIQLCRQKGICMLQTKNTYRLSASRFLSQMY